MWSLIGHFRNETSLRSKVIRNCIIYGYISGNTSSKHVSLRQLVNGPGAGTGTGTSTGSHYFIVRIVVSTTVVYFVMMWLRFEMLLPLSLLTIGGTAFSVNQWQQHQSTTSSTWRPVPVVPSPIQNSWRNISSRRIPGTSRCSTKLSAIDQVSALWDSYSAALESNPLVVKSVTASIILGAADFTGQALENRLNQDDDDDSNNSSDKAIDFGRAARFAIFGLVLQGKRRIDTDFLSSSSSQFQAQHLGTIFTTCCWTAKSRQLLNHSRPPTWSRC
jgi:hypothetical protein